MRLVALLLSVAILQLSSYPTGIAVAADSSGAAASNTAGKRTNKKMVPKAVAPTQPPDSDDDDEDSDDDDSEDDDSKDYGDGSEDDDGDDDFVEEYEAKIDQALAHHATKSQDLLNRALQEGGATATAAMEIGPDGNVVSAEGDVDDQLWQAEFALQAMDRQLDMLIKLRRAQYSDDEGEDRDDEEEDDEDEHYTYYPERAKTDPILKDDPELVKILDAMENGTVRNELYGDVKEEAEIKAKFHPNNWFQLKYWELHSFFGCARVFAGSRPVYDAAKWEDLRQFWYQFVVEDKEDMPIPEGSPERTYQLTTENHDPPLVPFQTKVKGRGLKAAQDIPKGELIFKGTNNTVIFTHGHTWRRFLFGIYDRPGEGQPPDAEMACDVLVWSWVQRIEEDGDLVIVADFDNGSLLNEGRDEEDWEPPNVRCGKEGDTMCHMEYYATKDIKEGDELLCDYRGFALLNSWSAMGL